MKENDNKQTKLTNNNIIMYEPPTSAGELVIGKLVKGELIREGDWVGSPNDLEILKMLAAKKNVFGNIALGVPISIDTIKLTSRR